MEGDETEQRSTVEQQRVKGATCRLLRYSASQKSSVLLLVIEKECRNKSFNILGPDLKKIQIIITDFLVNRFECGFY